MLLLTPDNGKYYLELDAAQDKTELIASVEGTWFGGGDLNIGGTVYAEGVTVHAPGELVYFLGSAFDRFETIAAVSSVLDVPVQMKVFLDDVLAYDSGDQGNGDYDVVSLDVSGVSIMRLVTSYSGGTSNGAHSSWVDAHLTLPAERGDGAEVIFTEDFENYGQPDGAGWTDFNGTFVDSKLGIGVPGVVFSGGTILFWFDTTTDPLGEFKPYAGATAADDPANIQNTYAVMSDGTNPYPPEGVEITYGGGTGQTFEEGHEYFLKFVYFNRPNLAGIAFTAELYNVGTGITVASAQFAEIGMYAYEFNDGMVSYIATALDDGAEIGVRFIGTPAAANLNQLGLDNITVSKLAVSQADPEEYATNELEYAGDVSSNDLLHGLTATAGGTWLSAVAGLNDGVHGISYADAGDVVQGAWATPGASAEFELGTGANGTGYDVTSIQSIASWSGGGFSNQAYTVEVKAVGGSWTILETVDYQPLPDAVGDEATKVTLSDESGVLASGIEAIRFTASAVDNVFEDPHALTGSFVWREIDVFGAASAAALDQVEPTLVKFSPDTVVDGSIRSNVSPTTQLVAKFSEDVQLGSGDITILNLDSLAETVITLPDAQVSIDPIDASILMIEPTVALLENTRYAVCIDSTAVDDLAGNSFAGVLDPTIWTFTTRGEDPLKILCIGDSITVGYTATGFDTFDLGYRGHLYNLLNDAGYVFQFVGESEQPWVNPFNIDPTDGGTYRPVFEQDLRFHDQDYHQGGEGASIGAIQTWFQSPTVDPDLVLLKIGINSIQEGVAFTTVRDYIFDLVDTIMTQKPDAHVIVAQIIPYSGDYTSFPVNVGKNDVLYQYNVYIRDTLSGDLAAAGHDVSKYSTVDLYSMFLTDPNDYTSAVALNRHSNNYNHPWNVAVDGAGYDTMAQQWFDAIEALNIGPGSFSFWLSDPALGIDLEEQGFEDDPDGDGLASGLELWFGTNPNSYNLARISKLSTDGTVTTFEHPQGTDFPLDVQGSYEWSMNLSDWFAGDGSDGPVSGEKVLISPVTVVDMTMVTATASEALDSIFLRAKVTQN